MEITDQIKEEIADIDRKFNPKTAEMKDKIEELEKEIAVLKKNIILTEKWAKGEIEN